MQALFADESDPGEAWAIHHRLAALRNHRTTPCDMSARLTDNHPFDFVEGVCRLRPSFWRQLELGAAAGSAALLAVARLVLLALQSYPMMIY
uniref:Uncharacterized protein n=1 Tax=Aegilops tauschii subsp. strangulata TaxID=200361 RepID=A0A453DEB0_AEGTS